MKYIMLLLQVTVLFSFSNIECIQDFISTNNRKPYVLDIGCGTGLLSMQAARAGAAKVYGCEMFPSWCEVARANVKENGLDNIVTIINKHSSKLIVKNKEYPRKYGIDISYLLTRSCKKV